MKIIEKIIDFIYPPRCPICEQIIPYNQEKQICSSCKDTLPYILAPRCSKCSKPINDTSNKICFDCNKKQIYYEKGWALWLYEGTIKKAIYQFKYNNKKEYGKLLTKEVVHHYYNILSALNIDICIPVPMHKKRLKKRGYNQALIIADVVGKAINVPVEELLIRKKETIPQKSLSNNQRNKNLKNAFELKQNNFPFKNVLLIDDIYTTGSTINNCAKTIKTMQPNVQVYFLSICIGKGV